MKRSNWRRATRWFQRQGTAALVATAMIGAAAPALGDIVPNGDVTPDNLGDDFPFGGAVPGGTLVVGGTGSAIGGTATGQLTIDIPSDTDPLTAVDGFVGRNAQGNGLIRVVSLNSELVFSNSLVLGEFGRGTLEVASGARVATNGAGGGGGIFDLVLGNQLTGQGLAVVDGDASLLLSVNTAIGGDGFGSVEVYNRGRLVSINSATVGDGLFGEGSVLLDGSFTNWIVGFDDGTGSGTFDGELIVGNEGAGAVVIQNQARAQVLGSTVIGSGGLGYGEVVVNGRNSALSTGSLVVGFAGTAFLNIENRGFVRSLSDTEINDQGFINLAEGTLFSLAVNNNGGVIRGSGTVSAPIVVNNGDIRNAASVANLRERLLFTGVVTNNENIESIGGEMEFLGAVTNTGANSEIYGKDAIFRFRGGLDTVGGQLNLENTVVWMPAAVPLVNNGGLSILNGTSTLMGDITMGGSSTFSVYLGDANDRLSVNGAAALGGTLNLELGSGYTPQLGDSFTILSSNSLGGTEFAGVASPGALWSVGYTTTSVVVTYGGVAPPGMGADFNGDGVVDGNDLAVWKSNFGKGSNPPPLATQAEGDANGDGVVDGADFMIIQRHWGGPPAVPALAAVPEPSSMVLAMAALAIPLACRRRGSR